MGCIPSSQTNSQQVEANKFEHGSGILYLYKDSSLYKVTCSDSG